MAGTLDIVALISGGGRTVLNLQDKINAGEIDARIVKVISSRDDVAGVQRCKNIGLDVEVVASKDFRKNEKPDWQAMSGQLNNIIIPLNPSLIVFAGFMCYYIIPDELEGRVMNIHPALIPSFCGKGMWGHHVHEAVVEGGLKVTGCTVHFVNNQYDAGPIILQRTCPVYDTDSAKDVAERVFAEEEKAYPEAIRLFAEGKLKIDGRIVKIER